MREPAELNLPSVWDNNVDYFFKNSDMKSFESSLGRRGISVSNWSLLYSLC